MPRTPLIAIGKHKLLTTARRPQKRTAIWQKKFIAALREYGVVSKACEIAGVERSTAYRARLDAEAQRKKVNAKGDSPTAPTWMLYDDFSAHWDEALEDAIDSLEAEARRRAIEGVEEPITFQGMVTGTVQKYSDTLLVQQLKAHRPEKYRDRHELTGAGGAPLASAVPMIYLPDNERSNDSASPTGTPGEISSQSG